MRIVKHALVLVLAMALGAFVLAPTSASAAPLISTKHYHGLRWPTPHKHFHGLKISTKHYHGLRWPTPHKHFHGLRLKHSK